MRRLSHGRQQRNGLRRQARSPTTATRQSSLMLAFMVHIIVTAGKVGGNARVGRVRRPWAIWEARAQTLTLVGSHAQNPPQAPSLSVVCQTRT